MSDKPDKPQKQLEGLHILMTDGTERYYSVPPGGSWELRDERIILIREPEKEHLSATVYLYRNPAGFGAKISEVFHPLTIA